MSKKLKFPSLILLAGALASPIGVYADVLPDKQSVNISQQSGKVTGVVEDALGPGIGASVVIKGTTNGIMTDLDGKFTLDNICKHLNIILETHHRAVDDATATGKIFVEFISMLKEKGITDLDQVNEPFL